MSHLRKFASGLQSLHILLVIATTKFLENPRDFFSKVTRRLEMSYGLDFTRVGKSNTASAAKSNERLYLSKAESALNVLGVESVRTREIRAIGSAVRIVYLATNSLPFTKSGYTIRTHNLLTELAKRVEILPITRLGYPADVGIPVFKKSTAVESIVYRQMILWGYSRKVETRVKREVEFLADFCKQNSVTLIHTTTPARNAVVASRVANKLGIPWIYELRGEPHNTWLSKFPPGLQSKARNSSRYQSMRELERQAVSEADGVVFLSHRSQEITKSKKSEAPSVVIPNAVSHLDIEPNLSGRRRVRKSLNLEDTDVVIGSVTSIVDYEGLDYLIEAVELLPNHYRILVVGDGPDARDFKAAVAKSSSRERFMVVGWKPNTEISDWYAALDVFVVPRRNLEVCRNVTPLKPLIASAQGIPVVCSDLPALREITGNMADYCDPSEPHLLAETIIRASQRRSSSTVSQWAKEKYSWSTNAELLTNFYNSLLGTEE